MQAAKLLAKWLLDGEFTSYFTRVPSAAECAEPTVVREGGYERVAVAGGEERGVVTCAVHVAREVEADADTEAQAMERWLRRCDWDRHGEDWPWRVVEVDTTVPRLERRDSSGRFVYSFDVMVTVVRELG